MWWPVTRSTRCSMDPSAEWYYQEWLYWKNGASIKGPGNVSSLRWGQDVISSSERRCHSSEPEEGHRLLSFKLEAPLGILHWWNFGFPLRTLHRWDSTSESFDVAIFWALVHFSHVGCHSCNGFIDGLDNIGQFLIDMWHWVFNLSPLRSGLLTERLPWKPIHFFIELLLYFDSLLGDFFTQASEQPSKGLSYLRDLVESQDYLIL